MSRCRLTVDVVCLFAVALLLSGCMLSRQSIRKAQAIVTAAQPTESTCHKANHCAQPSLLLDQAHAALAASTPKHPVQDVTLLDRGETALAARLNLIHGARRSIDLQTYIFDDDDVGNLVLDALVHAARRGVHVRVLADQLFSFPSLHALAALARTSANLKIRLYNPTFDNAETSPLGFLAGALCCFTRINQRMHNKLLLVDDSAGITGGRNYGDRYFGWDPDRDFRDRDILVAGPVAREMGDSFQLFWHHPRSTPLVALRDVNHLIRAQGARAPPWHAPPFQQPARVAQVRQQASDPAWIKKHILDRSLQVSDAQYFSDLPAKTADPARRKDDAFTLHIMRMVANARHQIVLQTPYLVLSHRARRLLSALHEGSHAPRIIVSTNSLASTDVFFAYGLTYKHMKRNLTDYGFQIYELKPHPADAGLSIAPPPDARSGAANADGTGPMQQQRHHHQRHHSARTRPAPLSTTGTRISLHAKSIVVDDKFGMVGTHNFDPRSDHYNTESGVIIYDKRFATELRADILRDTEPQNAWTVAPRKQDIPIISPLNKLLAFISSHLPWFDLWPFRYATLYQLKPGCAPLLPSDPNFYDCYESVGDFPGVKLPFKTIFTRLVTGFGFGLDHVL